jgi:hypothetical protein
MLTQAQIAQLLDRLRSPVTAFDCGPLCAPGNGGVPVCCHAQSLVPVLYKAEFALLRRRSRLWRRFAPKTQAERAMLADGRPGDCFALCKGHLHCERENRSIACRTFPFEPYLDHDRKLAGLVFHYDFAHLCPLIRGGHVIEPQFVREAVAMWEQLFAFAASERALYFTASQSLRRSFGQKRRSIPVFTCEGLRDFPTRRSTTSD